MFNEVAAEVGWPKVQRLSPSRRASLSARLRECGGLDGWRLGLAKARGSPFLCGDNRDGWKADFDFLVQAKSFTKLMEGSYDRTGKGNGTGGKSRPHDALFRALAEQSSPGYGVGLGEAGADVGVHDNERRSPKDQQGDLDLSSSDYRRTS
jgi:hypothetical protein